MAVKMLIADDHKILREGLRTMFEKQAEREIVGEAEDGVSAVRMALELRPDIIILDINMPKMDGIEVTQRLSKELPETKIIGFVHVCQESLRDRYDGSRRIRLCYERRSFLRIDKGSGHGAGG